VLGSVANKVLHGTRNHLLLVRPGDQGTALPEEAPLKTVIVPLDGSELAETVLPHVTELAKAMNAEVLLVRVHSLLTEASLMEGDMYTPAMGEIWDQIKKEAWRYLEEKDKELRGQGVAKVSHLVLEGHLAAAGEIIDLAKKTPDNLVAMCTHGRSGVGRWVLGSVTERVVRYCGDPVLVIRAES
jgi:nucleotide-binding universal stress UspA family protein